MDQDFTPLIAGCVRWSEQPCYLGVLRSATDYQEVWTCEHRDHETPADAIRCARAALNNGSPRN